MKQASNKKRSLIFVAHRRFSSDHVFYPHSSNIRNDALLHRLVHTQLLSGSLNRELDMTAAQRRRALSGRVLELAGDSKLGKGECAVLQEEKQRASKRVRDGMAAQQKKRDAKSLDEACSCLLDSELATPNSDLGQKHGKLPPRAQETLCSFQLPGPTSQARSWAENGHRKILGRVAEADTGRDW